MQISEISALETGGLIKRRKISAPEVLAEILKVTDCKEPVLNAYSNIFKEEAMERAKTIQAAIDKGIYSSPLAGVPMAVKDNISTKGFATTCGSKILENYSPVFSAEAYDRLYEAGCVLIGKTNMDEFAMGGSTETAITGPTSNPWDTEKVAGGSSGGSAAAVIAGEAFYALGSDTGGSIRQPCAFCGVTGIKPTYGAVSRYGLVAYASSLDQIGPMGKDIWDCAAVLSAISGPDHKDLTAKVKVPFDFSGCGQAQIRGLKIGIPKEYFGPGIDDTVKQQVLAGAKTFESLGATIEEFSFDCAGMNDLAVAAYYIIASAEASSNLSRYDGVKYGLGPEEDEMSLYDSYVSVRSNGFGTEVKRRILLGTFVLSSGYYEAFYLKALKARNVIKKAFDTAFSAYDMVLSPVSPTTAYGKGAHLSDPMKMYLGDVYTVSANLAGLPAVSLPCGFDKSGLPIGLQLIGKRFSEETLINAAMGFQTHTDYHRQRPEWRE